MESPGWLGRFTSKLPTWVVGVVLIIVGVALSIVLPWKFPRTGFLKPFGEAATIAGLLAIAVDPFLKRRLLKEATKDIFFYILGYNQHQRIKDRLYEIVTTTNMFRKDFRLKCTLAWADSSSIRLDFEYEFELINPSNNTQEFQQELEFQKSEKPVVHSMTFIPSNGIGYDVKDKPVVRREGHDGVLYAAGDKLKIAPTSDSERYRFYATYSVTYPFEIYFAQHFGRPTIGVELTIEKPDDLVAFARDAQNHQGSHWVYNILFMPGDHINIRWEKNETAPPSPDSR
jgi:hypothetical protein